MASKIELIEHICQVVEQIGIVRSKKMFGDYLIYIDEKPCILVCDNIPYIKMLPEIEAMMEDAEIGLPYEGAKPHYILDIDHSNEALTVLRTMLSVIPYPKKRSEKKR